MSELDAAWAAGLYEGEGSVTLLRSNGRLRPKVQFSLGSTDEDVLRKFASVVGVGKITGPYQRKGRKTFWHWRAHGFDTVRLIIRLFGPYLGLRRTARLREVLDQEPPPRVWVAHNNKLSPDQVREIRRRLAAGESQTALGREFGVTQPQIWRLRERITYRNVI